MCEDAHIKEQWQLLQCLRTTVECLLVDGVLNVWNVYGGLNRLHNIMERIFKHGCRIFNRNGEPDCWIFIQGLNWLQPSLAVSPVLSEVEDYLSNLPARITSQKDMLWLYKSLESHSLSHKLSWLLSDKEHLLSCFEPWAFLCQENLAEATLLCLRAVERSQPVLLTEIDPSLFLPSWISPKTSPRRHQRSSSYPINFPTTNFNIARDRSIPIEKYQLEPLKISSDNIAIQHNDTKSEENHHEINSKEVHDIPLRTWNSVSSLTKNYNIPGINLPAPSLATADVSSNKSSKSQTCSVELSKIIDVNYADVTQSMSTVLNNKLLTRPRTPSRKTKLKVKMKQNQIADKFSEGSDSLNNDDSLVNTVMEYHIPPLASNESSTSICKTNSAEINISQKPRRKASFLPGSAPEFSGSWSLEIEGQKDIRTPKKSFMEDGGSSVQPMAIGYFPRPIEGQSLTSFLASAQFFRANAELDRENAHFSVSDAMIAAIEQVKCNKQWCLVEEAVEESDEEINSLKQRIRLRRHQRQEEQCNRRTWNRDLLSDGKTDTTTTDQSVSPLSTSSDTPSEPISTDDVEDLEIDDELKALKLKYAGLSISTASLFAEAEYLFPSSPAHGTESTLTEGSMSAEGVALSLISRFNEKQLPRASELQWLVSEKEAPQTLLPMPKSWPVNSDEVENSQTIPLRGNMEWAPPRPQIIFTPHPPPVRRTLIAKQNYRCAGCGMKVAVKYANKFRYCEYLGRYFCTGCHTNQVTLIPGKVLSKWDFNRYHVSNFSYRLLDQMMSDPLFQVNDLNPLLYRRIKQLDKTRLLRTQLFFFKDFLFTCRFASSVQEVLKKEPNYIISDPHVYSIQDLIHVKYGILPMRLQELVQMCNMHIIGCELCHGRGFVCEICFSKDVIFPWELSKVHRCEMCGACFHNECKQNFNKADCPRCRRLHDRRTSREETF
ncbi:run domain Beclin-1-interacting and cysteine-rich domain-containing protein isoform X2 [Hylaeus anthracinus]|uniref:run domain Beclin-1-interacting and cysteine-rich domain-containing protein isoform X2 n=1 Tax=Hylaeus volcanicus TaxID=313075 RepID=UPI0023B881BE|nr:run domain Beclin-1-interacting and cysteine-rich domain-containing protein isoform X2 [Hylaeus volcanicus]XP_053982018.1 run domain Beclin-1-interacting and cysteine-rich domain-containing protein isoform X2 [Hylaeus volcanicus]XP_053998113.1 run domain Beclin-1-interacting and cysteine-rich domain-containing protein isoform X2 [Hylaeus anthracinus]XP_053998114.1 run domain Beclin-1-interacting and cysteine-rich domain-containing protein isoform X2 [Hylaeus anthracinus]